MTGRRAYEMFTRSIAGMSDWARKHSQFSDLTLVAYDELDWREKDAWKALARQIDQHAKRSAAARSAS